MNPPSIIARLRGALHESLQDAVRDVRDSFGTDAPMLKALQAVWPHLQWMDAPMLEIVNQGFNDYVNLSGKPPREVVRFLGGTAKDIPGPLQQQQQQRAA